MKGTLLSKCSWWVKTSSFLYQMELAKAHLIVVDIGIVENTNSNKRFELSLYTVCVYVYALLRYVYYDCAKEFASAQKGKTA